MKNIIITLLAAASVCCLDASVCSAQVQIPGPSGQIFLDDYNGYAVQTGNPPPEYYQVNLAPIGVTDVAANVVSGNAVFAGVDFSGGSTVFGGGLYGGLNANTVNLTGGMLSAMVKSSAGLAPEGYFAFRIGDGAGHLYRSALFNPGSSFTQISAPVSSFIDNFGAAGPIDLTDIVEVDLLAYNLGENLVTTLYIDDLQAFTVPEPSTNLICLLCLGIGLLVAYQRRQSIF